MKVRPMQRSVRGRIDFVLLLNYKRVAPGELLCRILLLLGKDFTSADALELTVVDDVIAPPKLPRAASQNDTTALKPPTGHLLESFQQIAGVRRAQDSRIGVNSAHEYLTAYWIG
jgi:enoyl-CoA hydratase/carnithine racemase